MLQNDYINEIENAIESRIEFFNCEIIEREVAAAITKQKPDKHGGNGFYSNLLMQNNANLNGKLANFFDVC